MKSIKGWHFLSHNNTNSYCCAIASRKIKGGIGIHLGLGILIAFTYILFMQISTNFATKSKIPAKLAVWIPNIIYGIVCIYLIKKAVK